MVRTYFLLAVRFKQMAQVRWTKLSERRESLSTRLNTFTELCLEELWQCMESVPHGAPAQGSVDVITLPHVYRYRQSTLYFSLPWPTISLRKPSLK